jgi:hypothetical protein
LQRLLSNNEQVATKSETWLLLHCANIIKPELINATFSNTLTQWAFKEYKESFENFDFKEIEKNYILSLYEPLLKKHTYLIDKTPRYWEIIDEIPKIFPKAKIIVLKRNPEDILKSIMKTWQLKKVTDLVRFKRDLLLAPQVLQNFLDKQKHNTNVREVKYEELQKDLVTQTKMLYNWLNLPFNEEYLLVENNNKTKGVFGDPYQNSSLPYKNASQLSSQYKLSQKQENFIKAYMDYLGGTFLKEFGYEILERKIETKSFSFEYFKTLNHEDHFWKEEKTSYFKKVILRLYNEL